MSEIELQAERAADLIDQAHGLLITAGAGMGVDSGLPDFRGREGFWAAYPALGRARIRFQAIASPEAFRTDPTLAWGFYAHRLQLYRNTTPHEGFRLLREIGLRLHKGVAVFTSNVDGQFQKSGFREDLIAECHGSIHHLQCVEPCCYSIWTAKCFDPQIDVENCRLVSDLPACPWCGGLARPNVLMFMDPNWIGDRTARQRKELDRWCESVGERLLVIEIGAGTAIPSVRHYGQFWGKRMIRINPREAAVRSDLDVAMPIGALQGIQLIARAYGVPVAQDQMVRS